VKKLKLLVVSLFLLFSLVALTACQQKAKTSGTASPDNKKVTLTLWHFDPGVREQVYKDAIKRFEAKHSNVTVKALLIPNDTYKQRLVVANAGKNAPDVFSSWGGGWQKEIVDSGKVLDLTKADIDYSRFNQIALKNSTYDEKIYGVPLGISPYVFFYNKAIFTKYGLEVPKTYDDLLKIINVLNKNKIYPLALANQPKWPGAFYLMYFADRIGGEQVFQKAYQRESGGSFADPAYIEAGKDIQDLVKKKAFNTGFNGLPYDAGSGRQLIYSGKAAMMLTTSGFVNNVRQEYPNFEKDMGVFQFPSMPNGKGDSSNMAGGVSPVWSINKNTKNAKLATELVDELSSVKTAEDYANKSGTPVAVKGVEPKDPYVKTFTKWLNDAHSIQFPYDQTLTPELGDLHKETTFELFGLTMTPEQAAQKMEQKAQELSKK
jgi:raffinose/stachyose/melibiose transport system substrate-binding protein